MRAVVFSSYIFLFVFLPAFVGLYFGLGLLRRCGAEAAVAPSRTLLLLLGSYVFYGWERYWYVSLILASTAIDFIVAGIMGRSESQKLRKLCLIVSIVANLGMLAFFKYRNFAIASLAGLLAPSSEAPAPLLWPQLVLPVGISFYTFQSMSYTIDVYRRVVKPVAWGGAMRFASYVALFPQLVAGPIVRYRDIADQLVSRTHSLDKVARGLFVFMLGFAKKTLIANQVGVLARSLFHSTEDPGFLDAWGGVLAYALQIYFDFSGYSDMAIGLGLMLGFRFPVNFDSPYKAQSITDFWRRWHISLSTWLRDYLYVPLGGNRDGARRTYRNLMLTMLLGGLWHGAAWTFVFWGAWHGALLALERGLGRRAFYAALPAPLRVGMTFMLVCLGWVFFEAQSLGDAMSVIHGCFGFRGIGEWTLRAPSSAALPLFVMACGVLIAFFGRTTQRLAERPGWPSFIVAFLLFHLGVQQMLQSGFNPFLYFQF